METQTAGAERSKKINTINEALAEIKPEIQEAFGDLKNMTFEAASKATAKVQATAKGVDKSVHANAWTYIGGAVAASAIVGFLAGRKLISAESKGRGETRVQRSTESNVDRKVVILHEAHSTSCRTIYMSFLNFRIAHSP